MKKYLLAATALALVSGVGAASAADLPIRKGPPVAPVYVPPAFTWTGFYVGVNAGYGWANNNHNDNLLPFGAVPTGGFFPVLSGDSNRGGFLGGVQAGYNFQFTPGAGFVLGVEADIDYADWGHRNNNNAFFGSFTLPQFPGTVFTPAGVSSRGNSDHWFGTARLRAGYAWDRLLIFATGGLAYGSVDNGGGFGGVTATTARGFVNPISGVAGPSTAFGGGFTSGGSKEKAGWTLGAGVEYAFTNNFTVKAEYLYANFGHAGNGSGFILPGAVAAVGGHRDLDVNIVRLGLNYKFW